MTRKPQQTGPTAEDISRHEEMVAAYLNRAASEGLRSRWQGLWVSERLGLMLGIQTIAMSVKLSRGDLDADLSAEVAHTMAMLDFQIRLERSQGKT